MEWKAELELATEAARKAGAFLRDEFTQGKAVLSETGRDIKLQADRDAEAIILESLGQSEYGVLAEESGEHGDLETDEPIWIVDPLDGTMNYKRGLPLCCVSVALSQSTEPVVGAIYDFLRDECFHGVPGEGAWLNGEPMRVSDATRPEDAILATGFPVHRDYSTEALADFLEQGKRYKKIRMLGSAALMLAYVACGRVDAYREEDIMFWDVAAGVALVRAAGGYARVLPSERVKWGRRVTCGSSAGLFDAD